MIFALVYFFINYNLFFAECCYTKIAFIWYTIYIDPAEASAWHTHSLLITEKNVAI